MRERLLLTVATVVPRPALQSVIKKENPTPTHRHRHTNAYTPMHTQTLKELFSAEGNVRASFGVGCCWEACWERTRESDVFHGQLSSQCRLKLLELLSASASVCVGVGVLVCWCVCVGVCWCVCVGVCWCARLERERGCTIQRETGKKRKTEREREIEKEREKERENEKERDRKSGV